MIIPTSDEPVKDFYDCEARAKSAYRDRFGEDPATAFDLLYFKRHGRRPFESSSPAAVDPEPPAPAVKPEAPAPSQPGLELASCTVHGRYDPREGGCPLCAIRTRDALTVDVPVTAGSLGDDGESGTHSEQGLTQGIESDRVEVEIKAMEGKKMGPETTGENDKIVAALVKAQASIEAAKKNQENPFYKSGYADLAAIVAVIKKPFSENGLAFTQSLEFTEANGAMLVTKLLHISGQSLTGLFPVRPVKDDPQGWGSAQTYARRYGLAALVGVAVEDEDDDGNMASKVGKPALAPAGTPAPAPKPATNGEPLATSAQLGWIQRACLEANKTVAEVLVALQYVDADGKPKPLTKERASALIGDIGSGAIKLAEL